MAPLAKTPKGGGRQNGASHIPQHEIDTLARCFLPAIQALFESEEGQREFAEWKRRQAEKARPEGEAERKPGA